MVCNVSSVLPEQLEPRSVTPPYAESKNRHDRPYKNDGRSDTTMTDPVKVKDDSHEVANGERSKMVKTFVDWLVIGGPNSPADDTDKMSTDDPDVPPNN